MTIYLDLNSNGVFDPGEPRAVTMLDDPSTTAENESGHYWLEDLTAGAYEVREVVPDGFVQSFPSTPFRRVNLQPGQTIEGIDFGNRPIRRGSIHGLKWRDDNANGQQDVGEPGLAGVTIYIDLNDNQRLDLHEPRAVSMQDDPNTPNEDETGRYWLQGLFPGSHIVREVVPDGFEQIFPLDIQGFPSHHFVTVAPDDVIDGIDFGNRPTAP